MPCLKARQHVDGQGRKLFIFQRLLFPINHSILNMKILFFFMHSVGKQIVKKVIHVYSQVSMNCRAPRFYSI